MALLGSFTETVGMTTMILAISALWLVPYPALMPTHVGYLSASFSIISASRSTMLIKKGRLPKNKVFAGLSVLVGIVVGSLLLVHTTESYSVGKSLDLVMQQFPEHRLDPALLQRNSSQFQHLTSSPIHQQFEQLYQAQQSTPDDLAHARILWTIIYVLHGVSGVAILLGTIIAAITWPKKGDPERT